MSDCGKFCHELANCGSNTQMAGFEDQDSAVIILSIAVVSRSKCNSLNKPCQPIYFSSHLLQTQSGTKALQHLSSDDCGKPFPTDEHLSSKLAIIMCLLCCCFHTFFSMGH